MTDERVTIPAKVWVDQPRTAVGRWWRRVVARRRARRFERELIAAMCKPIGPDDDDRGCLR